MSGAAQLIVLDGAKVPTKDEMVSLTGLWRAAGSDLSKQPAKWRELPSTKEFAAHVAEVILQKSEDEIFAVTRGGKSPATYAHWQIAMSYARYLDPAFAARCNEVVRAHMERRLASTSSTAEALEAITRTFGICRMLAAKITKIEKLLDGTQPPAPKGPTLVCVDSPKKKKARQARQRPQATVHQFPFGEKQ